MTCFFLCFNIAFIVTINKIVFTGNNESDMVVPLHVSSNKSYLKREGPAWYCDVNLSIQYNSYTYFFLGNEGWINIYF